MSYKVKCPKCRTKQYWDLPTSIVICVECGNTFQIKDDEGGRKED